MIAERTRGAVREGIPHRESARRSPPSPEPVYVPPPPPRRSGGSQPPSPPRRRPMAHRGPRVVRRAKELTWRSPMMAAVVVGAFLVSLLCCYVYAYARVTSAGFE